MHSCCAVSLQSCCHGVQSHIVLHAPAWLKSRSTLVAFRPKTFTHHPRRTISYTLQNLTPRTLLPRLFLNQSSSILHNPAKINGHSRVAPWRDYHLSQVMSPSGLLNRDYRHFTEDPCSSTDRAQRRPTILLRASRRPRIRTWTTTNIVLCWLHHCTHRSEKDVQNDRKFITLNEKTWCPVHLKIRQVQGNLSQCFSSQKRLNQDTFSDRDEFSSRHRQVLGSNEPFFRFSNPVNVAKSLLDGNRDHMLAEARSELMKQKYKVESLNTCTSDLQRQTYAQRLELEDAHHGYVESRREQVRLQEELVMKEKALRDTRIRNILEVEELKRAQELRVNEFSVKIERTSWHDTETHSTNTRVAREGELHEWFWRISG